MKVSTKNTVTSFVHTMRKCVVVIGPTGSGKTTLMESLVAGTYSKSEFRAPTVGFDLYRLPGLQDTDIWEIAGQSQFQTIGPRYYRKCQTVVLVLRQISDASTDSMFADMFGDSSKFKLLIITGRTADFQTALSEASRYFNDILHFPLCEEPISQGALEKIRDAIKRNVVICNPYQDNTSPSTSYVTISLSNPSIKTDRKRKESCKIC